ncbi:hypothetical protein [Pseudomonas aeruginosa]|uniref:hypothetical protein n=1 Tax=Pseudomonas aeruginosa TaxID=287 RepID=UPI00093DAF61|nr:hypothetical protein [Pseudomonas aeruginosa]MBG4607029.1 hypothetical protein [Pseudomonas aeruginosa]MBG5536936.1 hypothetical protein [Pseudomonas aeruginosa]MBG5780348.1 hypothetical protein [Pseudomonas aeruginosa]MBT9112271.1 hypothetical protein [Pseudomonas aeruginosa]MBT9118012.1 hypothetical protein [Pseudomonas aeruginosa]
MPITPLEQTLIDHARSHQEALAAYYPKHQAGPFNEDDHAEYLKHSGALTDLVSLTHFKSGLSNEAAEQLRQVDAEDKATFRLHFPIEAKQVESGLPDHTRVNTSDAFQLVKPLFDQVNS